MIIDCNFKERKFLKTKNISMFDYKHSLLGYLSTKYPFVDYIKKQSTVVIPPAIIDLNSLSTKLTSICRQNIYRSTTHKIQKQGYLMRLEIN